MTDPKSCDKGIICTHRELENCLIYVIRSTRYEIDEEPRLSLTILGLVVLGRPFMCCRQALTPLLHCRQLVRVLLNGITMG